jgi:hypothetical protein
MNTTEINLLKVKVTNIEWLDTTKDLPTEEVLEIDAAFVSNLISEDVEENDVIETCIYEDLAIIFEAEAISFDFEVVP